MRAEIDIVRTEIDFVGAEMSSSSPEIIFACSSSTKCLKETNYRSKEIYPFNYATWAISIGPGLTLLI